MDDTCAVRVAAAVLRDGCRCMDAGCECLEAVHLDAYWVKVWYIAASESRASKSYAVLLLGHAVYPAI
ncbi:hypothetical protein [Xanthomonas campestris]|uniref:hypothetical protein n=1 Tax=Xanthomonas campestris TaxID=339 RepID=UPI002B36DCE4|nr:hypothetical protein [Xanthomonas campestris pv. raphani]